MDVTVGTLIRARTAGRSNGSCPALGRAMSETDTKAISGNAYQNHLLRRMPAQDLALLEPFMHRCALPLLAA